MKHIVSALGLMAVAALAAPAAWAQSTGASPADPNNERNQQMAPSNAQPSDPAAADRARARIPTDPAGRSAAEQQPGGATGTGAGTGQQGSGVDPDMKGKQ